jgi:arylformamidase
MRWYDISMPVHPGMAVFPGDPAVRVRRLRSLSAGDEYGLSELSMGSHTGTHVDPPAHFLSGGETVDQIDPGLLNGPCYVLRVPDTAGSIGPSELGRAPATVERLLLRTRNSERWAAGESYFDDHVALTLEGAETVVGRGIRLVGIDGLSVEAGGSDGHPVHRRCLSAGVILVEGLCLDRIPEGPYELRCLPLRLLEGDGAPARAFLCAP